MVESVAVRQEENVLYKTEKSPRFLAAGFMQQFCKWVLGWITSVSEVKSPASSWTLVAFFQAVRCVSARLLRYLLLSPYRNLRQLIFVLKAGTVPYEHLEGCQLSTVATNHTAIFPLILFILLCCWIGIVLHKERTTSGLSWETEPGYPLLKINYINQTFTGLTYLSVVFNFYTEGYFASFILITVMLFGHKVLRMHTCQ